MNCVSDMDWFSFHRGPQREQGIQLSGNIEQVGGCLQRRLDNVLELIGGILKPFVLLFETMLKHVVALAEALERSEGAHVPRTS